MQTLFRAVFLGLLRLFYQVMAVHHGERIPSAGPCLVVANHPNGLMDPLVLRAALARPVGFLAKSTLFGNPAGRLAMNSFGAIPVYRQKDGVDTAKNEHTFTLCRERLRGGGWLAMFPEGVSHGDPELKPLKTGAARIALTAEEESGFTLGLRILPVGLMFEARDIFRSGVAVAVGEPVALAPYQGAYTKTPRETVEQLTQDVAQALSQVTLQAHTKELWKGFLAVAAWTLPRGGRDLAACEARARELSQAYAALWQRDQEAAQQVVDQSWRFVRMMDALGIKQPFVLEDAQAPTLGGYVKAVFPILTLWPLALLGAVLGWVPYRLIRTAAVRLAGSEVDLISTLKVLLGLAVMTLVYAAQAAVVGFTLGAAAGLGMALLGPLSGYVALRFDERMTLRLELLRARWLHATQNATLAAVQAARDDLCAVVQRHCESKPQAESAPRPQPK